MPIFLKETNDIAITCDIDWAPEEVIADTLAIFEKHRVKATLFCTHPSEVLQNCNRELFELAIHPNFNPQLEGHVKKSSEEVVQELIAMYPEAVGVRSHSMTQNSSLLQLFAEQGMKYDANHFLPYQTDAKRYKLWSGMTRIPYIWEDDVHWSYGFDFNETKIDLKAPGLKVFDFHPIHIFLNTDSDEHYQKAKKHYQDAAALEGFINTGLGARTILIKLCETIQSDFNGRSKHLKELID